MTSLSSADRERPAYLWRSGSLVPWAQARIHVNAVGHASAAAIFEGVKAYRASSGDRLLLFRLGDHLRRFYESARICRLHLPFEPGELADAIRAVLEANQAAEDTYVRPWAYAEGIIHEPMVPAGARCEVVVDTWPFTSELPEIRGCRAAVSSWRRIGDASMPPRVKAFANYHNGRLAKLEAVENGHDWPIMLNEHHQLSEGAGSSIALVRRGEVAVPALTSGVLEGITRSTAATLLEELGIAVRERPIDRTELYLADEIFFLGTGWEVLPVTTVDGLPVGDGEPGPVATALAQRYARAVRGDLDGHDDWLTPLDIRPAEGAPS